jgi:hypothetical protein
MDKSMAGGGGGEGERKNAHVHQPAFLCPTEQADDVLCRFECTRHVIKFVSVRVLLLYMTRISPTHRNIV